MIDYAPFLSNIAEKNGILSAVFIPTADFPGFQGHFPGDPVLPGICILLAARKICETAETHPLQLKSLKKAKFFRPVRPGDVLIFQITRTETERIVSVTCGEQKTSTMRVIFQ